MRARLIQNPLLSAIEDPSLRGRIREGDKNQVIHDSEILQRRGLITSRYYVARKVLTLVVLRTWSRLTKRPGRPLFSINLGRKRAMFLSQTVYVLRPLHLRQGLNVRFFSFGVVRPTWTHAEEVNAELLSFLS
jgi:hypothetical protein